MGNAEVILLSACKVGFSVTSSGRGDQSRKLPKIPFHEHVEEEVAGV
jgi:hypothetical protein